VGKFIPVEPEKWAEMVKAQAEVARLEALTAEMDKTINASQAECRRLKAEVVKYIEEASNAQLKVAEVVKDAMLLKSNLTAENARLKSELDRLKGGRP
jgi:uncharacterized small protein (DUF1192 family)